MKYTGVQVYKKINITSRKLEGVGVGRLHQMKRDNKYRTYIVRGEIILWLEKPQHSNLGVALIMTNEHIRKALLRPFSINV